MPPTRCRVNPTPKKSTLGNHATKAILCHSNPQEIIARDEEGNGKWQQCTATLKKSHQGKRKATIFGKHLNDESTSDEDVQYKCRAKFVLPSPPRQDIRALQRSSRRPDCTLFGPFRAMVYTGYFFCQNCQFYEDALTSGTCSKIKRDSRRFQC